MPATLPSRDYTFLGTTQSLCPECLALVPAKIIVRGKRVYFRKRCPQHGEREDFVCSDVAHYDQLEYSLPARIPAKFGIEPDRGCPYDCGLCTEHEQHTCVGIVELTTSCNLTCPMCYSVSAPGGQHFSFEQVKRAIDRLVEVEARPEIMQLSGGEPTVHPQFAEIYDYAISRPIDYVMINTNGVRLARDPSLVEHLARHRDRTEIYLQFDGLNDDVYRSLRGEPLLDVKLAAIEALGRAGLNVTLVATLQGGVNNDQMGPIVEFGLARPHVTGVSFQPATYSGRHVLPSELERRITFPDVIRGVAQQTRGIFREDDFLPLPCAHPNCHSLAIAWRSGDSSATNNTSGPADVGMPNQVVPVTRFIDGRANMDLLANGISFTRAKARQLILQYLGRQGCCAGGCGPDGENTPGNSDGASSFDGLVSLVGPTGGAQGDVAATGPTDAARDQFLQGILDEQLGARNLFRITITSFLDVYNFDVRRVMKCCSHHVLPTGHVIPFCAYNVLYRNGHVSLPALSEALSVGSSSTGSSSTGSPPLSAARSK